MTVGEKGVGRRFDRFSALSKLLDLQLGEMGVWAYLCFGRRFKRIWVNGGGVLWKEKGASDQDFACKGSHHLKKCRFLRKNFFKMVTPPPSCI